DSEIETFVVKGVDERSHPVRQTFTDYLTILISYFFSDDSRNIHGIGIPVSGISIVDSHSLITIEGRKLVAFTDKNIVAHKSVGSDLFFTGNGIDRSFLI